MSVQTDKQTVDWPQAPSVSDWLQDKPTEEWRKKFEEDGYLIVKGLLTESELEIYQDLTSMMLKGDIDTSRHRHDLGNATIRKREDTENICQIMWPSIYVDNIDHGPLHSRAKTIAKIILGQDVEFDFDTFISKAPHTDTETPWHQDESYWPGAEDKRSVSCWVAIDDAYKDNGCMWFVPGSHRKGMKEHRRVSEECHVRVCNVSNEEVKIAAEIQAGSCTFHHGRTLHYTRGNNTDKPRRAYVAIYRPDDMIKAFRNLGIDHGKKELKGTIHGVIQS